MVFLRQPVYCSYIQYPQRSTLIRILETPRLHRQRKGRRRTVRVMDMAEIATHFALPEATDPAAIESALQEAGWPYHRDAAGRLWSVARDSDTGDN